MKSPRVLICEDEGLTALRLKTSLPKLGYEVAGEARDGEEAVTLAEQLQPDLVLMDIRMPGRDGISAAQEIMESPFATAIVMITAFNDPELVDSALQAGATGYLVKPVSDEQIGPALTVALSKYAELCNLNGEVTDLKETLATRKLVDRAKGILMHRYGMTENEAYHRIQKIGRDRRQTMKKTAEQILAAAELLEGNEGVGGRV
ncbi:MAG: response regulator [Armatimonadetes bacterium]|nr:response regulator [Armatimonadota bacterium]